LATNRKTSGRTAVPGWLIRLVSGLGEHLAVPGVELERNEQIRPVRGGAP
jgi:hypothetical protein